MSERSGYQISNDAAKAREQYSVRNFTGPWTPGLVAMAALQAGERVLDLACGSGLVARLAAPEVGSTGRVTGLDVNEAMANTLIENGANCTISTNNVLNPFTPYGDCSLVRVANLYANIVQRYGPKDLGVYFEMITDRAAKALRLPDYGIEGGKAADLVVWNETRPSDIIAKCALPLAGFKRGRQLFARELPTLRRPG